MSHLNSRWLNIISQAVDAGVSHLKYETGLPDTAGTWADTLPPPRVDFRTAILQVAAALGLAVERCTPSSGLLAAGDGAGKVGVTLDGATVSVVALNGLGFRDGMPPVVAGGLLARNAELARVAWGMRTHDGTPFAECRASFPTTRLTADELSAAVTAVLDEAAFVQRQLWRGGLLG